MIILNKGTITDVYVTGSELGVLVDPYFLFVFTSLATNEVIQYIAENISTNKRYDKFVFDVDDIFDGKTDGFWKYEIYEQASSSNTVTTGLTKLEIGYMLLNPATAFTPEYYTGQSNLYKYHGN